MCYSAHGLSEVFTSVQSGSIRDTIVACATPPGEGALAIVRLSGCDAPEILAALTGRRANGESHRMRLARLYDADGELLDQAMAVQMRRPSSYTGEDVVELYLHGSCAVVDAVLARTTALGARLADPGEFTLRAFLNGRMTLAEAEGVGDLIVARTETQRRVAARHAGGELARVVGELLAIIEARLATWRAAFDFPDETGDDTNDELDRDSAAVSDSLADLSRIEVRLSELVRTARADLRGRRTVVLCGAPNVGKSTLLNALVGERRALVDESPGTTRDPIEVEIGDGLARMSLIDTAGLRPDATGLEADGIALARAQIARADLILWLVDPENPVWPDDDLFPELIVATKADLADANSMKLLEKTASHRDLKIAVWTSGIADGGVHDLRHLLGASPDVSSSDLVLLRRRHVEQMSIAAAALRSLAANAKAGWTLDVLTAELELAARALGEILGCDIDASVLDRIFSEFCIGK